MNFRKRGGGFIYPCFFYMSASLTVHCIVDRKYQAVLCSFFVCIKQQALETDEVLCKICTNLVKLPSWSPTNTEARILLPSSRMPTRTNILNKVSTRHCLPRGAAPRENHSPREVSQPKSQEVKSFAIDHMVIRYLVYQMTSLALLATRVRHLYCHIASEWQIG